ncbi:hypothetical protein AAE478_006854 [Parahypoxylon ruwenzoriense]
MKNTMKNTMKSFAQALLFTGATGATLRPTQGNGGCCFQLTSVGMVNETVLENHVGDLLLGGSFQQGGFCLDKTAKTIQDSLKHNCFMRAPDYQFECYAAGAVGPTAFGITSPKEDRNSYLTYGNGNGVFYACPISSSTGQTYDIYSSDKADKTGCLSVALALVDQTTACSPSNDTAVAARSSPPRPTPPLRRKAQASPQACSVSSSAPSLAPYRLSSHENSAIGSHNDSNGASAAVAISSSKSTVFEYSIPHTFLLREPAAKPSLCALQFRMPVCTSLPKDYPCYSFSGLEQEILSNSGMTFNLVTDDGHAAWNSTELHQVFPGENTIISTFECGEAAGSYGSRKMSWQVDSVRDFSLEFLHAGIGRDAEFQDGIGAWIVPCQ